MAERPVSSQGSEIFGKALSCIFQRTHLSQRFFFSSPSFLWQHLSEGAKLSVKTQGKE